MPAHRLFRSLRVARLDGLREAFVDIVVGQFAAFVINAIIFNVWGEHPGVGRYMLAVESIALIACGETRRRTGHGGSCAAFGERGVELGDGVR